MTLSRRALLLAAAGSSAAAALGPWRLAWGGEPGDRRLVLVILRGALDGLHAVPAWGDPRYDDARGALALPRPGEEGGGTRLDDLFGLHPSLAPIVPLWTARELAIVHAVGQPFDERSHFEAQDALENGTPSARGAKDGWLNRALSAGAEPVPAMALGQAVPLVLQGPGAVSSLDPGADLDPPDDWLDAVAGLYAQDPMLAEALQRGREARDSYVVEGEDDRGMGLRRRDAAFGRAVDALGRLLVAPDGPSAIVLDANGWDTHSNQGGATGQLANRLGALADGLWKLRAAAGPAWEKTVVLAVTEFGRTVHANGTGGSDHGTASVALLAGGAVAGGQVVADWPGLGKADLREGRDLRTTTDLRAVFKGVLRDHLGIGEDVLARRVFPESAGVAPLAGLVRVPS